MIWKKHGSKCTCQCPGGIKARVTCYEKYWFVVSISYKTKNGGLVWYFDLMTKYASVGSAKSAVTARVKKLS